MDHILGHNTNLKNLKEAISPNALSYKNGIKIEVNNRKTTGKSPNAWKLKQHISKLAMSRKIILKGKQTIY